MLSYYCLKGRKNTESKNPKSAKIKNGRIMLLSKCAVCDSKRLKFIKEQEATGLLNTLGIPLSKSKHKMNEIVNNFLLAGDKFMLEMHLRQPGFTYSASGPFTKSKERIQKFKETGDSQYFHQNELDRACFQHDMAYEDFKDLTRRTASDKILRDKAFDIDKNPKYDGYQRGLASMVYKFFDQKTSGSGIKNDHILNKELAKELHKPIIRKFNKKNVHLPSID